MKIKVQSLKSFKSNASFIKQNGIIPILSYLKFEDGFITKNNLHSFLIQKVGKFDEAFLVDEKILMAFIENTPCDEIEITVSGKRILISDGFTKDHSPTEELINFPSTETQVFNKTELTSEVLSAVRVTSNFILTDEQMPSKSHVFIGKKSVCGSNGSIAFIKAFDYELPEIVLNKETAIAISKFESIKFSQSDNYNFFETDTCKYGFIKPTYPFFDLTVFNKYDTDSPHFEVNKFDLIRFNDLAISSPSKKVVASFKVVSEVMKVEMSDTDYEREVFKDIPVSGQDVVNFSYMPVNLNQLLKNVPDADLMFYQSNRKYYITGESNFTTLIMEVIEPA